MFKHQQLEHGGAEPEFIMRSKEYFRSALSRQIAGAVEIRRRGGVGAILNSKSEFDRCRIPRLILEEEDEIKIREQENKELEQDWKKIEEQAREWEDQTLTKRSKDNLRKWSSQAKTTGGTKREQEGLHGARKRRKIRSFKHEIMGADWGEQKTPKEP